MIQYEMPDSYETRPVSGSTVPLTESNSRVAQRTQTHAGSSHPRRSAIARTHGKMSISQVAAQSAHAPKTIDVNVLRTNAASGSPTTSAALKLRDCSPASSKTVAARAATRWSLPRSSTSTATLNATIA